jgi:hypothetical protein
MYEPSIGRFLQRDRGIGGYAYADNNPMLLVDPSGNAAQACQLCVNTPPEQRAGSRQLDRALQEVDCLSPGASLMCLFMRPLWTPGGFLIQPSILRDLGGGPGGAGGRGARRGISTLDDDIARTFSGGYYRTVVLQSDVTVVRVHGGGASQLGRFLTREQYALTREDAIRNLVLPAENQATHISEITIPSGTRVYVGRVEGTPRTVNAVQYFVEDSTVLIPGRMMELQ